MGPGREFAAVARMLERWGELARGVGDDCAVLDVPAGERLCVSTDSSVEGVHFRREWLTPQEIGYRAATAALSDLAAMAARPLALLLAVSVPATDRDDVLAAVADGVGEAARHAGASIVGGDTTGGPALSLTVTVLGAAPRPVTRGGARPGDRLYVTGELGGPLVALRALETGAPLPPAARARFAHPSARVREAHWLAERGARAMIDVSDGLIADVAHLAAASGARFVVDVDRLPCAVGASAADAAASGEEYELALVAARPLDREAFRREFALALSEVGWVEAGPPGVEARVGGARVDLPVGYDHFSR